MGITRGTLAARIKEWGWSLRRPGSRGVDIFHAMRGAAAALATAQAPMRGTADLVPVTDQQRMALAVSIYSVVESELAAADLILKAVKAASPDKAERSACTLASISRTVRDVYKRQTFGMAFLISLEERPLKGPPSQGAEAPSGPATPIPAEWGVGKTPRAHN